MRLAHTQMNPSPADLIENTDILSRIWYYLCLTGISVFLTVALFLKSVDIEFTDLFSFPCIIHKATGFYCPGCGFTRSVTALLRGDFYQCFRYHPAVLCGLFLIFITLLTPALNLLIKKEKRYFPCRITWLVLLLGIIVFQCIVKNIMLFCFGIALL